MHYKPAKMSRQMPAALLTGPGILNYSGDETLTLLCPVWLNGKQETSSGVTEDLGSRGERISPEAKFLQLRPVLGLQRFREIANSLPLWTTAQENGENKNGEQRSKNAAHKLTKFTSQTPASTEKQGADVTFWHLQSPFPSAGVAFFGTFGKKM